MPKRVLFKIHVYAGTVLSLPLFVIALTGIVLGFYDPLRYAGPPYGLETAASRPLPPAALAERVRAAYPHLSLEVLYLPTDPGRAARAKLVGEDKPVLAFLDPLSGKTLAEQDPAEEDWLQFLYHLHRGQPLGLAGQIMASATGVLILLLWLAGLWLWWPKRHVARPWKAGSPRARLLGLHRWLGLWLGGLLVLLALAGALLNFAGPLGKAFNPPPRAEAVEQSSLLPLAHIVARAERAYPAAPVERIYFPKAGGALWQFRFRDGGRVFVSAASGQVLKVDTPFSHWTSLLYPLHSGRVFGENGPRLIAILGLGLLASGVSGLAFWRRIPRK
ncbi:MAG: PepSY-associated TM helix domain-containing protein [Pseudomonadota bacterium]|uniref:PepSY-associated TM helix domain-containing protein n=1 Tax=Thermithiobacillus tepidarius TaxID=929 RepID=UPI0004207C03|nr:PepSY-associated TM helix domain-containing protein [Thermithiobacillus tepidarius]